MNTNQIEVTEIAQTAADVSGQAVELAARELQDAELLLVGGGTGNVIF